MSLFSYTKKGKNEYGETTVPKVGKIISHAVLGIVGLILVFGSWTIVKPTEQNLIIRLGKIDKSLSSGLHFKLPWIDNVVTMDVSTKMIEVQASAASKDLQIVTTNLALQYELDESAVGEIYTEYKKNVITRVVNPAIQDAVKASTALYNADELITKRAEVKDAVFALLFERLAEANVILKNVDIVNFDFSESFNTAIEAKVTAEQKALEAENKLKQVEFEAQQKVATATAEAEAIRIQAQAINSQGGEDYVQLQAIEKWNGQLPTQMIPNATVPFLNLR